jgi:hypothetical protein
MRRIMLVVTVALVMAAMMVAMAAPAFARHGGSHGTPHGGCGSEGFRPQPVHGMPQSYTCVPIR